MYPCFRILINQCVPFSNSKVFRSMDLETWRSGKVRKFDGCLPSYRDYPERWCLRPVHLRPFISSPRLTPSWTKNKVDDEEDSLLRISFYFLNFISCIIGLFALLRIMTRRWQVFFGVICLRISLICMSFVLLNCLIKVNVVPLLLRISLYFLNCGFYRDISCCIIGCYSFCFEW